MTEDALPLKLEIASPDGRRMHVTCLDVMRDLGKTRMVYSALWEDRPVIVKVFTKWPKAGYHALREWRGLRQLEARRLNTPQPLFYGRIPNGWAVATEKIEGAVTARELWDPAASLEQKTDLLSKVSIELARQHAKGVTQADLHLGNFLVRAEEVFLLDPAMMRFRRGAVGRSRSVDQVAQLTSVLPERAGPAVEAVFRQYAAIRTWSTCPEDLRRLHRAHRRYRKKGIEYGVRKFLRTNARHQSIRRGSWTGVAVRAFLDAAGLDALTVGLDDAVRQGQVLKNGRTSFVSRTTLGGREVVIKRYNHKGLLHSLRYTLKGSRARRNWSRAHRLWLLGIATPTPLAHVEEYRGPLLWQSYIITEFVDAPQLYTIIGDQLLPEDHKQQLISRVVQLIDRMAEHGITHGDMKHTNILCNGTKIVLTDLDGMQVHRIGWLSRRRGKKDLARLLRDIGCR